MVEVGSVATRWKENLYNLCRSYIGVVVIVIEKSKKKIISPFIRIFYLPTSEVHYKLMLYALYTDIDDELSTCLPKGWVT